MNEEISYEYVEEMTEKIMPPEVKQKLIEERDSLGMKIVRATTALYNPASEIHATGSQKKLIADQIEAMKKYHSVLSLRINEAESHAEYARELLREYKEQILLSTASN